MVEIFGVVLGALILVSVVAIGLYLIVGVTVAVSTMRRAHRERQMADELDRVLEQVLGPRTLEISSTRATPPPVRRD